MTTEGLKQYPISEIFTSPQGEGMWSGTLMTFVRLAGCTVGKPYPKESYKSKMDPIEGAHEIPGLPIYTEKCTLYDGREFPCDTDYRVTERLTPKQIADRLPTGVAFVCITGGEPLMHDLGPLVAKLQERGLRVHVETSGTKELGSLRATGVDWLTVSPKMGALDSVVNAADELKLLVDENFDPEKLSKAMKHHKSVYLQPVNFEHAINPKNLKLVMEWQEKYPRWKVSVQLHKILEHYIEERVR